MNDYVNNYHSYRRENKYNSNELEEAFIEDTPKS